MVKFAPHADGWISNPYDEYRELRTQDPVHWSEELEHWVLTRYGDIVSVLKDQRFSAAGRSPQRRRDRPTMMVTADPPDHARLRRPVNHRFTATAIDELRPRIQALADELLDAGPRDGMMDVVADFARPFPQTIIGEMLGLEPEDGQARPAQAMLSSQNTSLEAGASEDAERREPFLQKALARHREAPLDDLLNDLLEAEAAGSMDSEETLDTAIILYIAGLETTVRTISTGVYHLLKHKEQLEALRRDPTLIAPVTEEVLRYDSPVHAISRKAQEDVELGGRTIARGQKVLLMLAAANRDPDVFDHPDELDIEREENPHIAFGSAIHACLGGDLARLEIQIAIGTLVRRFPRLRLASEDLVWEGSFIIRGLKSLPVALD
ncbi:MAG: cytochrome P450 [Chloroflexi bacterium]|nr:cytochrome P450 [Chloroflexota bacterium]